MRGSYERSKLQIYFGKRKRKDDGGPGAGAIKGRPAKGRRSSSFSFLKGKQPEAIKGFIQRLELRSKLFRFQRKEAAFEDLSDQERKEETLNTEERPELCQKGVGNGGCDVLVPG